MTDGGRATLLGATSDEGRRSKQRARLAVNGHTSSLQCVQPLQRRLVDPAVRERDVLSGAVSETGRRALQ